MILADTFTCDLPDAENILIECALPGAGLIEWVTALATIVSVGLAMFVAIDSRKSLITERHRAQSLELARRREQAGRKLIDSFNTFVENFEKQSQIYFHDASNAMSVFEASYESQPEPLKSTLIESVRGLHDGLLMPLYFVNLEFDIVGPAKQKVYAHKYKHWKNLGRMAAGELRTCLELLEATDSDARKIEAANELSQQAKLAQRSLKAAMHDYFAEGE